MKKKIDLIFSDLKNEVITENQAHQQVLDLFAVMPSLPSDDFLKELFQNNSDCYADTWSQDGPSVCIAIRVIPK